MSRFAFIIAAVAASFALTGQVRAESPFEGAWIGADAGYERYSSALKGGFVGVSAGWDMTLGRNWVAGVEVGYAAPGAEATESLPAITLFTASQTVSTRDRITGRVRFGRVFGDSVLVYGAIGGERFDVEGTVTTRPTAACTTPATCRTTVQSVSFEEEAVTAGVGVEWAVSDRWSIRAAYDRADGDAFTRNGVSAGVAFRF
jgi:opacity protein-like surface antigen